ncbi:MAG: EscD/YscD/HrpQ family type III secretion system periplasmic domain-containing protein, partial [Candidimonas sp.]
DAHYMDNGKVRIEGVALDQDHLDRVLNILRTQFPGLTVDSASIMLADDVQKRLLGKLLAAGFTDASLAWQEKKLVVTATVQNRAQYSALQALIADFNDTHGPIARLSASGNIDNRDAPFEIRTIVSGAQPYIVLANGQKILVGGSHDGYRLEAIEPRRIILQSDERIVIER